MKEQKEYTYTQAFEELQKIVSDMERGDILIDELSEKVKRASALIEVCRKKLVGTEEDVNKLLEQLSSEG